MGEGAWVDLASKEQGQDPSLPNRRKIVCIGCASTCICHDCDGEHVYMYFSTQSISNTTDMYSIRDSQLSECLQPHVKLHVQRW